MISTYLEKHGLTEGEDCFAIATIVRTSGTTAAKPGAKAVLGQDGAILDGWLGGGCVRGAIKAASLRAFASRKPQLISVTPEEALIAMNIKAGDDVDGLSYVRNGCPSKGTIDVFIEPYLPKPDLFIFGESPVALKLQALAPQFGWVVSCASLDAPLAPPRPHGARYVVIATQGQGDLAALKLGLADATDYIAFVGSSKKFASLSQKLIAAGVSDDKIAKVRAPAGVQIGAETPAEIALSILAELTQVKRSHLLQVTHSG